MDVPATCPLKTARARGIYIQYIRQILLQIHSQRILFRAPGESYYAPPCQICTEVRINFRRGVYEPPIYLARNWASGLYMVSSSYACFHGSHLSQISLVASGTGYAPPRRIETYSSIQ